MSATAADIARATRASRIEIREDSAVLTTHPNARDQKDEPTAGYFEDIADATSTLTSIASLVGAFRRRFQVATEGVLSINPLTEVPTYNLIDSELNVSADCLVTRFEVDLETQRTNVEVLV